MLEPVRAFDELLRVTRTGGRVVVIDGDWATLNIDSDDPNVEARRVHFQETQATEPSVWSMSRWIVQALRIARRHAGRAPRV